MTRLSGEVLINAPVEDVFDMAADERNEPRYNPRIVRAEKTSAGPVATGARFTAEPRGLGRRGQMAVQIMDFDRPRLVRTAIRSSYMTVDGTLTFEAVGAATRMSWDWSMKLLGAMRAFTPVLAAVGPKWERRNWLRLKAYIESRNG